MARKNEELAITMRFFHTIDVLRQMRKLRGLQTFTKKYNINYWNICTIKKEPGNHSIKVEWLYYLVRDYGVSADYLLTGVGNIMRDETGKSRNKVPALQDV